MLIRFMWLYLQVIHRFADHTSMHGVPKVINAKSNKARLFWALVCIGAGAMFSLQVSHVQANLLSILQEIVNPVNKNIPMTLIQCWTNVEDVEPTLGQSIWYKQTVTYHMGQYISYKQIVTYHMGQYIWYKETVTNHMVQSIWYKQTVTYHMGQYIW